MIKLIKGDCLDVLKRLPAGSVDAVVTDPPYPEIGRPYGRMTEEAWHEMMRGVVTETRRILRARGSAVFILQANSERVGRMRPWLWEFMAWTAREWNMVQDAYWWNHNAAPTVHCWRTRGLMRPSLKACVWLGAPDCYRNQDAVLNKGSGFRLNDPGKGIGDLEYHPSGGSYRRDRMLAVSLERGGSTPFNVIPMANASTSDSFAGERHCAVTPLKLCDWWVRYVSPAKGLVCDPFMGSGTVGLAALQHERAFLGIEKMPDNFAIAKARIAAARTQARKQARLATA